MAAVQENGRPPPHPRPAPGFPGVGKGEAVCRGPRLPARVPPCLSDTGVTGMVRNVPAGLPHPV